MTLLQVLRKMKWALELKWLNTGPAPLYNNTVQVHCTVLLYSTVLCRCTVQYTVLLGGDLTARPEIQR